MYPYVVYIFHIHVINTHIYKARISYRYKHSLLLRWPEVTFIKVPIIIVILSCAPKKEDSSSCPFHFKTLKKKKNVT